MASYGSLKWANRAEYKGICLYVSPEIKFSMFLLYSWAPGGRKRGREGFRKVPGGRSSVLTNMGPRRTTGTWFMAEIIDLGGMYVSEIDICLSERDICLSERRICPSERDMSV